MGYDEELKELIEIHLNNRDSITAPYEDYKPSGLDGVPYDKDLRNEGIRFWAEVKKLKEKYNIEK